MARPIILSNGSLHVGINNFGLVHDFYFPYVGLENHAAGQSLRHKVGIWIDGQLSWLDDGSWELTFKSAEEALVGHTRAKHDDYNIVLEFDDFVDANENVFLRNIHIVNLSDSKRDIRLFMHQAFVIGDTRSNTDTAQFLPDSDAVLHYHGRRAFIIGAQDQDGNPFDQHSIGLFGIEGHEGTYRDAEDGELSNNNVEHGRVDSTLRFGLFVEAHSSTRIHYWIAAGTSTREAIDLHRNVLNHGLHHYLNATTRWWRTWLKPTLTVADRIPAKHRAEFIKSAMIVKAHIDKSGAVIASTDTAMLNYSRDNYAYCWPRDGAYAVWPLIRLGYKEEPQKFFDFCVTALHPQGYLMHKYRADGALGSSWHPYVHDSGTAPPIQEDETALVLFVFSQFYQMHPSELLLDMYFESMIKPMANFMSEYIDEETGLPKPSYDLWEENFLTTTYTTSIVYAALVAAAELADLKQQSESAVKWRSAAEHIKRSADEHLYDYESHALRKGVRKVKNGIEYDDTIDTSSFFGAFIYGLFDSDSNKIQSTLAAINEKLKESPDQIGIARYENDTYRRQDNKPSNHWLICTLWLAEYYSEHDEHEEAERIMDWVLSCASSTGQYAEQVDPYDAYIISVSPLTWSHAEYLSALLDVAVERSS